jgi:membrane-bound serine protease (ClpP class)
MVLDIFVPTFGILTLGGITSFALGSVFLFRTPAFSVSLGLIVGVTAATVVIVVTAGYLILGAFNLPVAIGDDSMIGRTGTVKETLDPEGIVYVHGEYWTAVSQDGSAIDSGAKVEVTGKDQRELTVKKVT